MGFIGQLWTSLAPFKVMICSYMEGNRGLLARRCGRFARPQGLGLEARVRRESFLR